MIRNSLILILSVLISSCSLSVKEKNTVSPALLLKNQLKATTNQFILFGHQDDLAYGIGWNGIKGESDVKRVTGSYPVVFGWDIGNIGDQNNLDGVPFDSIKVYIQRVHQMGGINTISWHARYPKTKLDAWTKTDIDVVSLLPRGENHTLFLKELDLVAQIMGDLKDENGQLIPIIFRPWHEMDVDLFWWGSATCSIQNYKELFRFTVDYLRKVKKLDNLLVAYSPGRNVDTRESYLLHYPGDDIVDVLGLDDYHDFAINRLDKVVQKLSLVVDLAKEKRKIAAFTETGSNKVEVPNWYTTNLLQVLMASEKTRGIAYVMVWRNRDVNHYYVPYLGHVQAEDFRNFVNNEKILLLDEYIQNKK